MINCLVEIDVIARRYQLNPVDLLFSDCENEFLRLAYIRKIAEILNTYTHDIFDNTTLQ